MPIRDELIARTIEQLRLALSRLAVGEDDVERLRDATAIGLEVERLYQAHVGSGPGLVRRLGSEDLLDILRSSGTVDGERAYLLAAILEVDAATIEEAGRHAGAAPGAAPDDARDAYLPDALASELRLRALDLVLEAGLVEVGETDIDDRVERLSASVPPERRSEATWSRLHRFALARGAYARAEDALFAWLAHSPEGAAAAAGTTFYDHLDGVPDADLEAGDLPRDEVHEGRAAFDAATREAVRRT